jgi:hypothetical protein
VEVAAPAKARAAEPLDPNQSFTGPSAQLFRATITSLSAPIGQVVNDRAVAVQARCGTPATLREIRQFIQSPLGAQAISIATNEGAETDNCRNDTSPGCAATAAYRADYLASIADITCASQ